MPDSNGNNAAIDVTTTLTLANTAYTVARGHLTEIKEWYVTALTGTASAKLSGFTSFSLAVGDGFTGWSLPDLTLISADAGSIVTLRLIGRT